MDIDALIIFVVSFLIVRSDHFDLMSMIEKTFCEIIRPDGSSFLWCSEILVNNDYPHDTKKSSVWFHEGSVKVREIGKHLWLKLNK